MVESVSARVTWLRIAGRRVKLYQPYSNGTQSVNICTRRNRAGRYRERFFFKGSARFSAAELVPIGTLSLLQKTLRQRAYGHL